MNKSIRTYDDLLQEKQRLESLLATQKEVLVEDINGLKVQFAPAINSLSFLSQLVTRDKLNVFVDGGINGIIDILFRKLILARSGWITKIVVPFFVKNLSSHVVAKNKDRFVKKLFSWISHKNGHEKFPADPASGRN
jgi:hypothetical protein